MEAGEEEEERREGKEEWVGGRGKTGKGIICYEKRRRKKKDRK